MGRSQSVLFVVAIFCLGMLGADGALARSQTPGKSTAEAKRQAEANTLRKRLAKSKSSDRNFWRDIKRLEALGPPDVKIAVIRHPGGTVVYSYKNIAGLAIADDHIVLGPFDLIRAEQAALRGDVSPSAAFAVVTRERADWWPNGIVPFEVAPELETATPGRVDAVIAEYERLTPVRFQARNGAQRYVNFVKQAPFFSSMTDHIGRSGGENKVKIQTDGSDGVLEPALIDRSLRHELGHALGMYHEHNRKDRDDFVRIDHDCIDPWYSLSGNFSIEQESKTIGPYDFESIMHYPTRAGEKGWPWERRACFSMVKRAAFREPGDDTGEIFPNVVLSKHDVNALHHMYGRDGVGGAAGDDYGTTLLVHNFDSHRGDDDYPDLVVGAPGRANDRGSVFLYKGSATGFVLWKIITPSDGQAGQRFGQSLAAGDFDGDGVEELAVGAPRAVVNGKAAAGKVYLFRIDGSRDDDETEVIVKPETGGAVEVQDRFGHALAAGLFVDEADPLAPRRRNLAIGSPGARNGTQGRVGRVWVLSSQTEPRFRDVRVAGNGSAKFGQFGFALTALVDRPAPPNPPRERLVVAAPGVTLGGCGNPAVFTTRRIPSGLETVTVLSEPDAASPAFCPQDPNLSDAIDAFPNPFWDATFGSRLASGDFNGDGLADFAATGVNGRAHVFLVSPQGSFELRKSVSNRDFGESSTELSFGVGLTAGDLNGDGLDELIVGAPLAAIGALQNVGKAYIYKGCRPVLLDAARAPILPPGIRLPPHDLSRRFCIGGLMPWFRANQTDFQSQSLTTQIIGSLGGPSRREPMFPAFTENRAGDRFATSLAVKPPAESSSVRLMVGTPNKSLSTSSTGGTVYQFTSSATNDLPPFRNHHRSWTLTSSFTTRVDRDLFPFDRAR